MIWLALLFFQQVASDSVTRGEKVFAQNCSVVYCHGQGGAAGRGPQLRGRSFQREYLVKVTQEGIPNRAMPAFQGRLTNADVEAVVDYVLSLSKTSDTSAVASPLPALPPAFAEFKGPADARQGRELFFDATRVTRCSTCHRVENVGAAVGPDLNDPAAGGIREKWSRMRGAGRHVLTARLTDGESFPALRAGQEDQSIRLYDLTAPLPVMRTLFASEIDSLTEGSNWSHDSVIRTYSENELAYIESYLRWMTSQGK